MKRTISLLPVILLGIITACTAKTVAIADQEGGIVKEEEQIEFFDKVIMTGGGDVVITRSPVTSLTVAGSDSCLKSFESEVKSETLIIRQMHNDSRDCILKIHVSAPKLVAIQQDGGGNIKVESGFEPTDSFQCVLNGGGIVEMKTLKVNSFHATINGGGEIFIHADKLLKADINGGGSISYIGNPEVISKNTNGGSIIEISQ